MKKLAWIVPCLSASVFLLAGLAIMPYPGLQADEIVFWQVMTRPKQMASYALSFGSITIPLMQISYVGAVKALLYWPIFQVLQPSVWSVRAPTVLIGVVTIWLTWCWMKRISGVGAATMTTLLLGTDTMFLLTDTFDWGPVALQHVFLMGGLLALQRWLQGSSRLFLALGFFLWGLGLWDKALFIWPLAGLAFGAVCVFPREMLGRLRPRTVAAAAASLLLGAGPLVVYNLERSGPTVSKNVHFETHTFVTKARLLSTTIDGTALMGSVAYLDAAGAEVRPPRNILERTAVRIWHRLPGHRKNWMAFGYILALGCFVLLWRSPAWRVLLFLLIATIAEWALMASTKAAGYYSHHTILLWPFPLAFLGIAFSEAAKRVGRSGRPLVATVVAVLAIGNLLTTNRYLADFVSNGAVRDWTDAINPLVSSFQTNSVFQTGSAERIGAVEWGYLWQIQMMTSPNVKRDCRDYFEKVDAPLIGTCSPLGDSADNVLTSPDTVFIQHTQGNELKPGVNDRFRSAISALGYREQVERVVSDGNGRPIFEVFRIHR